MARKTPFEMDTAPLIQTTLTDPASNAITVAIVDNYSEILITTTTYGVDQTLPTPTRTGDIVRLTIINKSTSTHNIMVNNNNISPGGIKYFVWDGTSWTGNDGDIEGNDFLTPETGTRYYCPYVATCQPLATSTGVEDRAYWIPYRTVQEMVISSMTVVWGSGGTASTHVVLAIYDSDVNDLPANQLTVSSAMSTAAASGNAKHTVSPNIVVSANKTIWLVFAINSALPVWQIISVANIRSILGIGLGSSTPYSHFRTVLTPGWTTLPNPAPVVGDYILSTGVLPTINMGLINQG